MRRRNDTSERRSIWLYKCLFLLTAGLFVSLTAHAQGAEVWVADRSTEAPVHDAWVRVEEGGQVIAEGYTDAAGYIAFDISTRVDDVPLRSPALWVSAPFPNPTATRTHFLAQLDGVSKRTGSDALTVTMYNVLGQRVLQQTLAARPGTYQVELSAQGLATGLYVVTFEQGPHAVSRSVLVRRGAKGGAPALRMSATGARSYERHPTASKQQVVQGGPYTLVVRRDGYAEERMADAFGSSAQRTVLLNPVLDQVVAEVTPAGAEVALSNGLTIAIPAGAVAGTATVEFSTLVALPSFDGSFHEAAHLAVVSGAVGEAALRIPVADAETAAGTGVLYLADEGAMDLIRLAGTFDTQTSDLVVPLTPPTSGKTAAVHNATMAGTFIIEYGISPTLHNTSRQMTLPYYEQDGENCWAAAWLSLLKAYRTEHDYDAIYQVLQALDVDKDAGLSWWDLSTLSGLTKQITGQTPEIKNWVNFDNMIAYVMEQLDAGHPVMVQMPTHQVVMVGYEITSTGSGTTKTYLTAHDPQNHHAQTAYMRQDLSYFRTKYYDPFWFYAVYGTLVLPQAPPPSANLTLHLPDAQLPAKGLGFYEDNRLLADAVWSHQASSGLHVGEVPSNMTRILLRNARIWNTSDTDREVGVRSEIRSRADGNTYYVSGASTFDRATVPARDRATHSAEITVEEIKDEIASPTHTEFLFETSIGAEGASGYEWVGEFGVPFTYEIDWDFITSHSMSYVGKLYNEEYIADVTVEIEGGDMSILREVPLYHNHGLQFKVLHPGTETTDFTVRVQVGTVAFNGWTPPEGTEAVITKTIWSIGNHPDSRQEEEDVLITAYEGEQTVHIDGDARRLAYLSFVAVPGYRRVNPDTGDEEVFSEGRGEPLFVFVFDRFRLP